MPSSTDPSRSAWLAVRRAEPVRRVPRGETPRLGEFLALHPRLATDTDAFLDLLELETTVRDAAGDRPELAEYVRRFAHLAKALERRFTWLRQGGKALR